MIKRQRWHAQFYERKKEREEEGAIYSKNVCSTQSEQEQELNLQKHCKSSQTKNKTKKKKRGGESGRKKQRAVKNYWTHYMSLERINPNVDIQSTILVNEPHHFTQFQRV